MKILAVVLLFSFINFSLGCTGCVNLDDLTFSKVIKKFKSALVKFDMEYPFGDVHEVFATFASEVNNKTKSETDHPELLVAVVGMKDYGELDNKDLSAKYGLHKRTDGPIIKLFNDGDLENPISFDIGSDKLTSARLYSFVKNNAKVHVQAPGCVKALDKLAEKFVKNANKRKEILKEAEKIIEKIEPEEKQKLAKAYTALMKGTIENGDDHVQKQRERMTKLLEGKLSDSKREEINLKLNILSSFRFESTTKQEL